MKIICEDEKEEDDGEDENDDQIIYNNNNNNSGYPTISTNHTHKVIKGKKEKFIITFISRSVEVPFKNLR